jgi:hypothetical protein
VRLVGCEGAEDVTGELEREESLLDMEGSASIMALSTIPASALGRWNDTEERASVAGTKTAGLSCLSRPAERWDTGDDETRGGWMWRAAGKELRCEGVCLVPNDMVLELVWGVVRV